jgi:cytochrome P450
MNNSKFMDKSFEYNLIHPWLKTGLLTSSGEKWLQRRRLITPSFHFDILKDFLIIINEHAEVFVKNLKKMDKTAKIVLKPLISACSLDIICGKKNFNFLY